MSDNKNFLGMRVEGDIYAGWQDNTPQLSEEEVDALFAAVLGLRGVRGIAWTQYTPYFNDGDTCVFGVGDFYFAIDGAVQEDKDYFDYGWMEDDYEENGRLWIESWHPEFKRLVGERKYEWVGKYPDNKRTHTDFPVNHLLYYPIMRLVEANGAMRQVLLNKFGDHARIIIDVDANLVSIETYDHD